MNNEIILQSLTESFEVLKDSWETKKESIIACIVETEHYDGDLAMDMWLYILQENQESLKVIDYSDSLVHEVIRHFCERNEEYGSLDRYSCHAIMEHIAPHMIRKDNLIDYIFGKTINAGYSIKHTGNEYIPMLIGVILLIGHAQVVRTLIESISQNNNLEDISVGELFLKAKYYIREEIQHNLDIFGKKYTISNEVKMSLLDSLDIIKDKEMRAECTIAFLSL